MGKFDDIMAAVNKKYKGKYMTLGSDAGAFKMERLPTGILAIDAITYGGLPKGKIVVFWGNWSSAKTFTAFKTVARAQRTCKQCLAYMEDKGKTLDVVDRETGEILLIGDEAATFLDKMETMEKLQQKKNVAESEKAFDKGEEKQLRGLQLWYGKHVIKDRPYRVNTNKNVVCPKCACTEGLSAVWTAIEDFEPDFAKMAGVDINDLMIVRSEYAEQAIDISAEILRSGKCDLMVIDSVAMMTPAKEIEESAEKFQQGLAARLINKALRRWTAGQTVVDIESSAGTKPTLILINQVRHKIGILYGSPDVMPGGKGQTFANSLVLKFRGGKKTKNEDTGETVNHVIHVKVEKAKCCPPDEQGDFVIWLREHKGNYPGTTSEPKIVFETAIKEGIILKVKNSYVLGGKKYTTQKAAIAALTTDSLLLDATRTMILDHMNDRRLRHA